MKTTKSAYTPDGWHSVVWKMKLRFDAFYDGKVTYMRSWEEYFPSRDRSGERRANDAEVIRCTPRTHMRCLKLMNDVCKAAERRGFEVRMAFRCTRIEVQRDGAPLWLRIVEKSMARDSAAIKDVNRSFGREGRVGTGEIEVVLTRYGGGTTTFRDKDRLSLEHQVADIVLAMERHHVGAMAFKEALEASAMEREREARERDLQEARRVADKERREDLIRRATDWNHAQQIRAYVSFLRGKVDSGLAPPGEFEVWLAWALQVADELDQNSSSFD
ncbi:hypothetical protein [Paraburkholderia azotifigens]|uniref:hypothetical protein n=1 Tax=Paraburkholderia azotifigens TaxID=2057004 RepID=UPI0038B93D59